MKIKFNKSDLLYLLLFLVLLAIKYLTSNVSQLPENKPQAIKFVDLGLPSGNLWATCNVGISSQTKLGDYYAWGEVKSKDIYNWRDYAWCNGSRKALTKYNSDGDLGTIDSTTILDDLDDVARQICGSPWHIPTYQDFLELTNGCVWDFVKEYDGMIVSGIVGKSIWNGAKIFFPAAGYHTDNRLIKGYHFGMYSSSSLGSSSSDSAFCFTFDFDESQIEIAEFERCLGFSVRPVCSDSSNLSD